MWIGQALEKMKLFYSRLQIKNKVFLILDSLVVTACLLSFILLQVTDYTYDQQLTKNSSNLLDIYSTNIESELSKIDDLTLSILSSDVIQNNLPIVNNPSNTPDYSQGESFNKMSNYLLEQSFSEKYISSITLVSLSGNLRTVGNSTIDMSQTMRNDIIKKLAKTNGSLIWMGPQDNDSAIIAARMIRSLHYNQEIGVLIIRINPTGLVGNLSIVPDHQDARLAILSDDNQIIYMNDKIDKSSFLKLKMPEESSAIISMPDVKYLLNRVTSTYTQWSYIYLLPYQEEFQTSLVTHAVTIVFFLAILVLMNVIGLFFSKSITKPIQFLSEKMKSVQQGNFIIEGMDRVPEEKCDEVGSLNNDFIVMIDEIKQLITENYVKQILAKESQLKALQAQINPHFLYNTLDSIFWIAKENQQTKIASMVQALANLFRNSISNKESVIRLEKEVCLLDDYIMIQKIRFEERLNFIKNIDLDLMDQSIPKLTLQPIVENSIKHGLEKMTEPCTISVYSVREGDDFKIIISDNGNGIPEEESSHWDKPQDEHVGIGLKNIDERIKLNFGNDYGLSISSEKGKGTTVALKLPYRSR